MSAFEGAGHPAPSVCMLLRKISIFGTGIEYPAPHFALKAQS